ncbi:MAG: FG-GAP repeat domain-containing protein [Planctomycetota bacterium JB042]
MTARPVLAAACLACLLPSAAAQNWFDTGSLPTLPGTGETFGVGDFEGDGDTDLWFVEGSGYPWDAFRIVFNDGAGGFTLGPATAIPASSGLFPFGVPLVDVTGDGVAEVFFRSFTVGGGYALVIHPGQPGGSFGAPISLPLPAQLDGLAFGNVDGDATAEFATLHDAGLTSDSDHEIRWWNRVGGAFQPSPSLFLPDAGFGDDGVSGFAAVDWNGDGVDDLVAGESQGTDFIPIPTVAGAPTAAPKIPLPLAGHGQVAPVVGDLDGDGDDDVLAVSTSTPMTLLTFEQTAPGVFTLSATTSELPYSISYLGRPRWLADWDGDGDLDLLSNRRQSAFGDPTLFLIENQAGSFAVAAELVSGPLSDTLSDGGGPADFDGDGRPDFAAVNAVVFGAGRIEDSPRPLLGFGDAAAPMVTFDFEGDGDLDLVRRPAAAGPFAQGPIRINDGTGTFAALPTPAGATSAGWGEIRAVGDFDGQGDLDFLVTALEEVNPFQPPVFKQMHAWRSDHLGGVFDAGIAAAAEMGAGSEGFLPVADVDADGDLDVLDTIGGSGGVWTNNGFAQFTASQLFAGAPIDAFDLEGDGDVDYLVRGQSPTRLLLLRDDGAGFTTITLATPASGGFDPNGVQRIDLDADGLDDLVVGGVYVAPNGLVRLFRNTGSTLVQQAQLLNEASYDDRFAHFDVDGDGVPDLVAARRAGGFNSGHELLAYRGLGGGFQYEPFRRFLGFTVAGFADVDGDGDPDGLGARRLGFRRFDGPEAGVIRQYGTSTAGSGGAKPVLGASGPLRPGSTTAAIRLRLARGGAVGYFLVGTAEANVPDFGVGGFTLHTSPLLFVLPVPLGGTPGMPGQGTFDLDVSGLIPGIVGQRFFHQFGVLDPAAPNGVAASNGLELRYGM